MCDVKYKADSCYKEIKFRGTGGSGKIWGRGGCAFPGTLSFLELIPQIIDKTCLIIEIMGSLETTGIFWVVSNIPDYKNINEAELKIYHSRSCLCNTIETACLFILLELYAFKLSWCAAACCID